MKVQSFYCLCFEEQITADILLRHTYFDELSTAAKVSNKTETRVNNKETFEKCSGS